MPNFDVHPEEMLRHDLSYDDFEGENLDSITSAFKVYIATMKSDAVREERKKRIRQNKQAGIQRLIDFFEQKRKEENDGTQE